MLLIIEITSFGESKILLDISNNWFSDGITGISSNMVSVIDGDFLNVMPQVPLLLLPASYKHSNNVKNEIKWIVGKFNWKY